MIGVAFAIMVAATDLSGFAAKQNAATRVVVARKEREAQVKALFTKAGVSYPPNELYLRVFKTERQLEVWARGDAEHRLVITYPVCASSGDLGPKRKQGDAQVPEGFYRIDRFNPASNFYLSLGLDYPNASDRVLGVRGQLGGDIFIHGDCVTIGCVPIEDDIKALYLMALDTHVARGGASIPVHVFPRRLDEKGMEALQELAGDDLALLGFWAALRPGYELFEKERRVPRVTVEPKSGSYRVRSGR